MERRTQGCHIHTIGNTVVIVVIVRVVARAITVSVDRFGWIFNEGVIGIGNTITIDIVITDITNGVVIQIDLIGVSV